MKNLESTIEEICKIIPMTESQKQDVKNQLYDLVTRLQRPIEKQDLMNLEEITGDDGITIEISSDNPVYNEMLNQGGGDEKL